MKFSEYVNSDNEEYIFGEDKLWIEPMKEDGFSWLQTGEDFDKDEWLDTGYVSVELLDAKTDNVLTSTSCGVNDDIETVYIELLNTAMQEDAMRMRYSIVDALNEIEKGNGDKASEILKLLLGGCYAYNQESHTYTYKEV